MKYAQVWIWLSFALLVALLGLFVRREYLTAKEQVARDIGFVFLNAVRAVEGEAFNKFILQTKLGPDSLDQTLLNWKGREEVGDRKITIIKREKQAMEAPREVVRMEVEKSVNSEFKTDLKGNAAMIISMTVDRDTLDPSRNVISQIEAKFDSAMQHSEYPLRYQLLPVGDSLSQLLTIGSYFDIGTEEKYIAQIEQYQWQVWKKIWPQVLFSVFVLVLVGLAFWSMWQLLAAEKALHTAKDDLVQNISHELKTPIATLHIALEAIQQNPAKEAEYLQIARDEVSRLSFMVEKVLNQSLLSNGTLQMQTSTVNLRALTETVIRVMQVQAEKIGAQLSFEAIGTNFYTRCDAVYLSGVLYNLLDNAFKYAPAPASVQVRLEQKNGELIWSVTDSGAGIPKEYADKVFEKFFRIPKGLVHEVKGYGLGLTYCAEVVRLHHGTMRVDKNRIEVILHEADQNTLS